MSPLEDQIKAMFLRIFPDIAPDSFDFAKTQDQFPRWDSFSHMELVAAVEQEYGISLDMSEVVAIRTPQDFVDIVRKKKGA